MTTKIPQVLIEDTTSVKHLSTYGGNLEDAVADIGSATVTLVINVTPVAITSDLTTETTITLDWKSGCVLTGTHTLTIKGALLAGVYQLFGGSITATGSPKITQCYIEWFGDNTIPPTGETDADAATDMTDAIRNAINFAIDSSTDGRNPVIKALAGPYAFTTINLFNGTSSGMYRIQFEGLNSHISGGTLLYCTSTTEDAITVYGRDTSILGIMLTSSAARLSGATGRGIVHDGQQATTQSRCTLKNVRILKQPESGIYSHNPELMTMENVDSSYNGFGSAAASHDGFTMDSHDSDSNLYTPINNLFTGLRTRFNTGFGVYASKNATSIAPTFINLESYSNEGSAQVLVSAVRGAVFINPDIEDQATPAGTKGIRFTGNASGCKVIGGHFSSLTVGISIESGAHDITVDKPHFSNSGSGGVLMKPIESLTGTKNNIFIYEDDSNFITGDNIDSNKTVHEAGDERNYHITGGSGEVQRILISPATSPYTPDGSGSCFFDINTLGTSVTINAPTNPRDSAVLTFQFRQDATGSRNLTWDSEYTTNYADTGNIAYAFCSISFRYNLRRTQWIQESFLPWTT